MADVPAAEQDRESQFHELLDHAVGLGELFDRLLIASGNSGALDRADMPAFLLFEILHLTRLQFAAECHDLSHPWLAHAAATHLRPVLEGTGYIAFILGHETEHPVGTSAQRAGCLALARSREAHKAMTEADPKSVPPGTIAEGLLRVTFHEDLHANLGCPFIKDKSAWPCREADGKPCQHHEVWPCTRVRAPAPRLLTSPTMRRLTTRMPFAFRDIEQLSSLVLHQSLADRMLIDAGEGTNAFRNATYRERAAALVMGLSMYGQSVGWVMETIDVAATSVLRAYAASTWVRPDLKAIAEGEWDAAGGAGSA
ncbi:MAG: hypothetical protein ACYDA0_13260 [Candidatus Dormibacteraceae bacterium]